MDPLPMSPVDGDLVELGRQLRSFAEAFDDLASGNETPDVRAVLDAAPALLRAVQKTVGGTDFDCDTVLSNLMEAVVVLDSDGAVLECNRSAERVLDCSAEEFIGSSVSEIFGRAVKEDGGRLSSHDQPWTKALNGRGPQTGEVMGVSRPNGSVIWISVNSVPLTREGAETPHGVLMSFTDITASRQRELGRMAVQRAEELDAVLEAMVEGVFVYDAAGTVVQANSAAREFLGVEPLSMDREDLLSRIDARRPDGSPIPAEETPGGRALRGEHVVNEEITVAVHDGGRRPMMISCTPLIADNSVIGAVMVARDLTESREGEERLRASLREKEVLIKEIHHRVKNNLQIIASMLNLQTGCISDDYSRLALHDSQNRIRTLALVHEKLYSSGDVSQIAVKNYIRDLTSSLFKSLTATSPSVALRLDLADVFLDLDAVIPLALLLNELLSNSLQHAFPDGREGEIVIVLRPTSTSRLELVVADDGVGFPEKLDFRQTETLGLQLVCLLTSQLGGNIELERCGGTVFTIEFPESGTKGQSQ
jgi:PAS domain S-box-containing protein